MQGSPIYSGIPLLKSLYLALSDRSRACAALHLAASLVTYPQCHRDRFLSRPRGSTGATGVRYLPGRKREAAIPDREIISRFRDM